MTLIPVRANVPPAISTAVVGPENKISSGLIAGEDLTAGAPCYIAANNLVYMSGGSGVTSITSPGAAVDGFASRGSKAAQADAITLVSNVDFGYGTGMVPGKSLFIDTSSAVKGRLNDAAPFAGAPPCARTLDGERIRVFTSLPF